MLNKYFDSTFCINLKRRKDRLHQAMDEFAKHSINACFVEGIDGSSLDNPGLMSSDNLPVTKGDLGCTLSHLKVVSMAKANGLSTYLVFEDDVELSEKFNDQFKDYITRVPPAWDMLYLGGNHDGGFDMVDANVARIYRTFTTHAFAARHTIFDAMINVLGQKNEKVDICISSLHKDFKCFVFRPHIAFQKPGFSDILEREADYPHLRV